MQTPLVGFGYSLSRTSIGLPDGNSRRRFGVGAPRSKAGKVVVLESRPTLNLDQVQINVQTRNTIAVYQQLNEDLAVNVTINPNIADLKHYLQANIDI